MAGGMWEFMSLIISKSMLECASALFWRHQRRQQTVCVCVDGERCMPFAHISLLTFDFDCNKIGIWLHSSPFTFVHFFFLWCALRSTSGIRRIIDDKTRQSKRRHCTWNVIFFFVDRKWNGRKYYMHRAAAAYCVRLTLTFDYIVCYRVYWRIINIHSLPMWEPEVLGQFLAWCYRAYGVRSWYGRRTVNLAVISSYWLCLHDVAATLQSFAAALNSDVWI